MLVESPKLICRPCRLRYEFLVLTFAALREPPPRRSSIAYLRAARLGSSGSTWALGRFAGPMPNAVDSPCAAQKLDGKRRAMHGRRHRHA